MELAAEKAPSALCVNIAAMANTKMLVWACIVFLVLWKPVSAQQNKGGDLFSNIPLLCAALASEGLATSVWKRTMYEAEHQCITTYVGIGTAGPAGMATNIAYYVTGDSATRANSIKIVVNVNNRATKAVAKQRLLSATKTLFAKLGKQPPPAMLAAITGDKPFVARQPYGRIAYEIEHGKIDTLTVSIAPK